ncbi:histidine kinase dimerization/phosphoacceptor domain -containing protein [Lutibacter sp.]|uniref:histidine kinase dimerization/phosphoacceptor domain -containing protein n=1 Tax=Lutibacter sp. TaxID=1925666 RepID=UPI0025BE4E00|nr:histidine kinase dimerization/phosphoacceptor domain -containing protein [Lutibacter sp.]MCF6182994.1 ATP-binding protein [Lutibacter sp.]
MQKILPLLTFLILFISYGQQTKIDSLKNVLSKASTDIKKIDILQKLNKLLFDQSSPDEGLPFYKQMTVLSKKLNNLKLEVESYKYISEYYMRKQDFKNAEKVAKYAISVSKNQKNYELVTKSLNQTARVYHHFQKYNKAIEYYNKGIEFYKKHPVGKTICIIYSNLGIALSLIGKPDEAIKTYLKGEEYAEKLDDKQSNYLFLSNLGWSFMSLEQYGKAEQYLLKGLNDSLKIKDEIDKIKFHYILGLDYSRWGKFNKALKHDKISLKYFKKTGDKLYEFEALNSIAVVYRKMNQPQMTVQYSIKAKNIAQSINQKKAILISKVTLGSGYLDLKKYDKAESLFKEVAKDSNNVELFNTQILSAIYDDLSSVYQGKKKYLKALTYYKRFKALNDSILINQRDSKVTEIETKYQTEKKEKENLQLKHDKAAQQLTLEKESKKKWLLSGSLGISIITLGIFGFYYRRNNKQKETIENLQKELHHRIKNNLAIINRFIDVVKEEFNNEAFNAKLSELQNRISSINEVHKQLYNNKDITNLNLKKYIEKLGENVANTFPNEKINITHTIDNSLKFKADKSFPIGLIINEFLTNSYKYAFSKDKKGEISIHINESNNYYNLELADNGKGFPEGFDSTKPKTFGLRIMKLLTQQINGTFDINGANGVKLTIQFPK